MENIIKIQGNLINIAPKRVTFLCLCGRTLNQFPFGEGYSDFKRQILKNHDKKHSVQLPKFSDVH